MLANQVRVTVEAYLGYIERNISTFSFIYLEEEGNNSNSRNVCANNLTSHVTILRYLLPSLFTLSYYFWSPCLGEVIFEYS